LGFKPENISRLAVQDLAYGVKCRETDSTCPPVLQHSNVGGRNVDCFREFSDAHLPLREHDVEINDDGHQITESSSERFRTASTRSPRMTRRRRMTAAPTGMTSTNIMRSGGPPICTTRKRYARRPATMMMDAPKQVMS